MPRKDFAMKQLLAIATALLLGASFAAAQDTTIDKDAIAVDAAPVYHYTFKEVNFPGDTFTQLLGINNNNVIAGYHGSGLDPANPNKGFTYTAAGGFVAQNYPGSTQTQVIGINDTNGTAGFWVDAKGNNYGFYQVNGHFYNVVYPGTTFNQLLGFNNDNIATGFSQDAKGNFHPYSINPSPVWTSYLFPGTQSAQATGTNNAGAVVGFFVDSKNVTHGFQYINGNFHQLDYPGATSTQCFGTNDSNWIVGTYTDASGNTHGFLRVGTAFTSIDDPNGVGSTVINGINNDGAIVGFWGNTAAGISHGFIGTLPPA
jgi:probable HAF family extracellular repeat protein